MSVQTEAQFDDLTWHDCHIWGLQLVAGDPDEADWRSDLALDIDFIVEWLCAPGEQTRFRVAPATLVFHGVTDLKIAICWSDSGFQCALHEASVERIERSRVEDQKVFLDRPYYAWRIVLNWPAGGEITFGAVGFSQTLRAEPIVSEKQQLSLRERQRALGPKAS